MEIQFASKSQIGSRKDNQDYLGYSYANPWYCFVVTDGCGGYVGSGLAAKNFGQALLDCLHPFISELNHAPKMAITAMFRAANKQMSQLLAHSNLVHARTTCAAVWLNNQHTIFAHIGDSRIYRISHSDHVWHSKDHSIIQNLLDEGAISELQAQRHPLRNVLTQSIGLYEAQDPTIKIDQPLHSGEAIILATDGFWSNTDNKQLCELAHARNLQPALDRHIATIHDACLELEYWDDISAFVIRLARQAGV